MQSELQKYRLTLPRWDVTWTFKNGPDGGPMVRKGVDGKLKAVKRRPIWDALWLNGRPAHYRVRARAVRTVIAEVVKAAEAAGLADVQGAEHMRVELVWSPGFNTPADSHNLHGLLKPCVDALARGSVKGPGLHVVPDDRDHHVTQSCRISRPSDVTPEPVGLFLDVEVRCASATT
jgi:hypothetical protein